MITAFRRDFPADLYASHLADHLRVCNRLYPQAWRQIDQFRAGREQLGDWPAWCYCPIAAGYSITCAQHDVDDLNDYARQLGESADESVNRQSPTLSPSRIAGLAAWRTCQGIYAIDDTIRQAVLETPLNGAVPVEVLFSLPQWCIYVPTPGFRMQQYGRLDEREGLPVDAGLVPIWGFFAWLEHDSNRGHTELRMLVDQIDGPAFYGLFVENLFLERGLTLEQSYEKMLQAMRAHAKRMFESGRTRELPGTFDAAYRMIESWGSARLAPLISLLCYLCSQTAEYRPSGETAFGHPANTVASKTRHGWRLFPPDRAKVWYVGERLGQAIREAEAAERDPSGTRSGPRPHVRRAHWHGFWRGPRSGQRRFELRWLPPIAVALADDSPEARMKHAKLGPIQSLDAAIRDVRNELESRDAPAPGEDRT